MKTARKSPSLRWLLLGPLSTALCTLVLLCRAAPLLHHPVWLFSFSIALILSIGISLLSLQEQIEYIKNARLDVEKAKSTVDAMTDRLDETQVIAYEKVLRLEEEIRRIELEGEDKQEEAERFKSEGSKLKSVGNAFRESLLSALDDLRATRQEFFFFQEVHKEIPSDLPHLYKQLRGQFEEKTFLLEQTRKRLFTLEGELIARDKAKETALPELPSYSSEEIEVLLQENESLRVEISALEEVITAAFNKKKTPSQKKQPEEQLLQLQF